MKASKAQSANRIQVSEDVREVSERIERALSPGGLTMAFQPVVNLRSGIVTGAEALSRFQIEPKRTPDVWFAEAWDIGRGIELELAAVRAALAGLAATPEARTSP
jgi:sensor c-di-GMP phosphodiesterase-like protein